MRTFHTLLIAASFILTVTNVKAQSPFSNEPVTAETIISMIDGQSTDFAISPIKIQQTTEGFAVKWATINERNIASFELEGSGDKKNFTSIKKLEPGAPFYAVDLNTTFIQSEKTYFRVKINLTNGVTGYTDLAVVKMKKANKSTTNCL